METLNATAAIILATTSLLLVCCDDQTAARAQVQAESQDTISRPNIVGYGDIKLGTSFKDLITDKGIDLFNPLSVSDCFKDLPIKGCFILPNMAGTPYDMKEGIPYTLALTYNKFDHLTDIDLDYDREGGITKNECLGIHERTLDWLVREYGNFESSIDVSKSILSEEHYTAQKNRYFVSMMKDGNFITSPIRTINLQNSVDHVKPITTWNNERYVSLLSTFIVVDGVPYCSVGVGFSEPRVVDRHFFSK